MYTQISDKQNTAKQLQQALHDKMKDRAMFNTTIIYL